MPAEVAFHYCQADKRRKYYSAPNAPGPGLKSVEIALKCQCRYIRNLFLGVSWLLDQMSRDISHAIDLLSGDFQWYHDVSIFIGTNTCVIRDGKSRDKKKLILPCELTLSRFAFAKSGPLISEPLLISRQMRFYQKNGVEVRVFLEERADIFILSRGFLARHRRQKAHSDRAEIATRK